MAPETDQNLTSSLQERRLFPPPPEFAARAHVSSRDQYDTMYRRSV